MTEERVLNLKQEGRITSTSKSAIGLFCRIGRSSRVHLTLNPYQMFGYPQPDLADLKCLEKHYLKCVGSVIPPLLAICENNKEPKASKEMIFDAFADPAHIKKGLLAAEFEGIFNQLKSTRERLLEPWCSTEQVNGSAILFLAEFCHWSKTVYSQDCTEHLLKEVQGRLAYSKSILHDHTLFNDNSPIIQRLRASILTTRKALTELENQIQVELKRQAVSDIFNTLRSTFKNSISKLIGATVHLIAEEKIAKEQSFHPFTYDKITNNIPLANFLKTDLGITLNHFLNPAIQALKDATSEIPSETPTLVIDGHTKGLHAVFKDQTSTTCRMKAIELLYELSTASYFYRTICAAQGVAGEIGFIFYVELSDRIDRFIYAHEHIHKKLHTLIADISEFGTDIRERIQPTTCTLYKDWAYENFNVFEQQSQEALDEAKTCTVQIHNLKQNRLDATLQKAQFRKEDAIAQFDQLLSTLEKQLGLPPSISHKSPVIAPEIMPTPAPTHTATPFVLVALLLAWLHWLINLWARRSRNTIEHPTTLSEPAPVVQEEIPPLTPKEVEQLMKSYFSHLDFPQASNGDTALGPTFTQLKNHCDTTKEKLKPPPFMGFYAPIDYRIYDVYLAKSQTLEEDYNQTITLIKKQQQMLFDQQIQKRADHRTQALIQLERLGKNAFQSPETLNHLAQEQRQEYSALQTTYDNELKVLIEGFKSTTATLTTLPTFR